jgi:predicted nucleotidyltransferase
MAPSFEKHNFSTCIKEIILKYSKQLEDSTILGLYLHGSVVKGGFIEGWSDLDFLFVLKIDSKYFDDNLLIRRIIDDIHEKTRIKCGTNIVFGEIIQNKNLIDLKTTCYLQNLAKLEVLFQNKMYSLPEIDLKEISNSKFEEHALFMLSYFLKVNHKPKSLVEKKDLLRKYFKNILFCFQLIEFLNSHSIYWDAKSILRYSNKSLCEPSDYLILNQILNLQLNWKHYNDEFTIDDLLTKTKKILQKLLISFYESTKTNNNQISDSNSKNNHK